MEKKQGFVKAAFNKFISGYHSDKKKLLKSIVSLVLALIMLVTGTFCWYCIQTSTVTSNSDNFSLDAGKGLRVNDSGIDDFKSDKNNYNLIPASSVDGRNIFFPADGDDFSDETEKIIYRSANAGDKNYNYIQIDFDLTAQANNTAIYIDTEKTSLKVKGQSEEETEYSAQSAAPLRMAIWAEAPDPDNGAPFAPIVFNSLEKTVHTAAVSEVDHTTGKYLSNGPQVAHQFSDYAVGATPVTTLKAGKKTDFSVIIWLEGCDPKSKFSKINTKDIQLKLAFKTSWDNTEVIRFKDENGWVASKINSYHYKLNLRYTKYSDASETSAFTMYPYSDSTNEWTASIPSDMRNKIEFILSPPSGTNGSIYTFCVNSKSVNSDVTTASAFEALSGNQLTYDREVNRQFVVDVAANNTFTSACRGYWKALGDSEGGGVDIGDLDGDDF